MSCRLADILLEKASWLSINKFSNSFFAKVITLLTLTAFFLGNFPEILKHVPFGWKINLVFVGSVLFVTGHLLAAVRAPPEFLGRHEVAQIVADMLVVNSTGFCAMRKRMLQTLTSRFKANPPGHLPDGLLQLADSALQQTASAGDIFKGFVLLKQYDNSNTRFAIVIMMTLGLILMMVPTLLNILRSGASLFSAHAW